MEVFHSPKPFKLENGQELPEISIAYQTYGKLNARKDNVIWICHALTANAEAARWWPGVVGLGKIIDPSQYFIVCANILGSCYGTTGPISNNPHTGAPYYQDFPVVSIRDMVKAHILLRNELKIDRIGLLMGGSMGGYQAMEWALLEKERIDKLFLIATSAAESAWGIAIHTAQRLAIEADCTWTLPRPEAGQKGLKAARAIGILTYRNYGILKARQSEPDINKTDDFKASSYVTYQGDKLVSRFNAYTYWLLTKAMDSHNLARGRGSLESVLKKIDMPTLIVGINSDILCPLAEQEFMASHMPSSAFIEIDSAYGHDGFMVEAEKISQVLRDWLAAHQIKKNG